MNMLWQGATPADLYMGGMIQGSQSGSGYPPVIYDFQTDVWTPNNTGARYPRLRSTASYNGSNNYGQLRLLADQHRLSSPEDIIHRLRLQT